VFVVYQACRRAAPHRTGGELRITLRGPYDLRTGHSNDIVEPALREPFSKVEAIPIRGISERELRSDAPTLRGIELVKRNFPFLLKVDRFGDASFLASCLVARPFIRKVETHSETGAGALVGEVKAHSDLTIIDPTQGPRVLACDPDWAGALFRKTSVVEDETIEVGKVLLELESKATLELVGPGALGDALLETLAHCLNLGRIVDEAGGKRLDALTLAIEEQADDILAERLATFSASEAFQEGVEVLAKLPRQFLECGLVHSMGRSHLVARVNKSDRVVLGRSPVG
jgi:hypothetical protein